MLCFSHVDCPHGCVASEGLRLRLAEQLPICYIALGLLKKLAHKGSHKKQRAEESAMCETCDSESKAKATVYCASCGQDLCAEHDGSAHASAKMSSHSRVPLKSKAALFKALADGAMFKQSASSCKTSIQGALDDITATGMKLTDVEKGHAGESTGTESESSAAAAPPAPQRAQCDSLARFARFAFAAVCTQLDSSLRSLAMVRSAVDNISNAVRIQTQVSAGVSRASEVRVRGETKLDSC